MNMKCNPLSSFSKKKKKKKEVVKVFTSKAPKKNPKEEE